MAGESHPTGSAAPRLLPLRDIQVSGDFWAPKLRIYREQTIPHSWNYMGWELRAVRRAAGESVTGDLNGTWGEANLYKFMETAAHSLAQHPDPSLERRLDEIIDLLGRVQRPDGFVHVYIINSGKEPWDPSFLDGSHTGYVLGHMIEAAVEYHAATGKRKFLEIAQRAASQAWEHFLGPNGKPGFCGHAGLEMALVELYRVDKNPRHLELSKAFVEWRGRHKVKPFSETPRAYFQDEVPLSRQATLEGHAVRAVFFATGVADLASACDTFDYRLAAHRFWDSTARRRMTITGAIGPRKEHEAFGEDYELPNDGYYESCAACGLADFAQRMWLIDPKAEYIDVLERTLYNTILHGISLDGTNSYYQNPLNDKNNPRYNSWVCCPPNLSRTLFQAGRYAYGIRDREAYVNLYVGGTCALSLPEKPVRLSIQTAYPWKEEVLIQLHPAQPQRFALNLRIPSWCSRFEAQLNGQSVDAATDDRGYLRLSREWKEGDVVRLRFEMPVVRMEAHPNIRDCAGKVALQRGPLVYGFEGLDQPDAGAIVLGGKPAFQLEHRPDFLRGVTVITGTRADGKPFCAVPFYVLANRAKSSQTVWVSQEGFAPSGKWWEGRLYRHYGE